VTGARGQAFVGRFLRWKVLEPERVGPSYGPPAYVILEVWKGLTTRATVILHGKELP